MRGTFVYDVVTTVGMVLMVFLIIYWAVQYGADLVSGMLLNDPAAIQGTLAAALSFSCRPYDYTFSLENKATVSADVSVKGGAVQIIPPQGKLRDWTSVERGGFVHYRGIGPSQIVSCTGEKISDLSAHFEKSDSKKFIVSKKSSSVGLEVK